MKTRRIAVLSVLALVLATIGGWQAANSIAVQALESSIASPLVEQTVSPDPKAVTWEYKILSGSIPGVLRLTSTDAYARSRVARVNLEDEINRYAAQGYVVESFQPLVSAGGSDISLAGSPEIVVLLKRLKK